VNFAAGPVVPPPCRRAGGFAPERGPDRTAASSHPSRSASGTTEERNDSDASSYFTWSCTASFVDSQCHFLLTSTSIATALAPGRRFRVLRPRLVGAAERLRFHTPEPSCVNKKEGHSNRVDRYGWPKIICYFVRAAHATSLS
jgi:hypothetical protein